MVREFFLLTTLFFWSCTGMGGAGGSGVVFGRILGIPSKYDVSVVIQKLEQGRVTKTKTIFLQKANDVYKTDLNFAWKLKSGDWQIKSFIFEGAKYKQVSGDKKPRIFATIKGEVIPQNPHNFYLLPGKSNYIGHLKFIGFETVHSNIDLMLSRTKNSISGQTLTLDKNIKVTVLDKFGRARVDYPREFPKLSKQEVVKTKMNRVRTFSTFSSKTEYQVEFK